MEAGLKDLSSVGLDSRGGGWEGGRGGKMSVGRRMVERFLLRGGRGGGVLLEP